MSASNVQSMTTFINFLITLFGNVWSFATRYWVTTIPFAMFAIRKAYQLYRKVRG